MNNGRILHTPQYEVSDGVAVSVGILPCTAVLLPATGPLKGLRKVYIVTWTLVLCGFGEGIASVLKSSEIILKPICKKFEKLSRSMLMKFETTMDQPVCINMLLFPFISICPYTALVHYMSSTYYMLVLYQHRIVGMLTLQSEM